MAKKIKRTLPGDKNTTPRDVDVASMIRVNHAGEYGAKRIYEGQLSVLRGNKLIRQMAEQEEAHLDYFEKEIVKRGVRPTALHPLWHAAGFALGAITARMGEKAAMACTVAVETVIAEHYADQLAVLEKNPREKKLASAIRKFKAEEEEHHHTGLAHGAEDAPAYALLSKAIMKGTKLAVRVAKRI